MNPKNLENGNQWILHRNVEEVVEDAEAEGVAVEVVDVVDLEVVEAEGVATTRETFIVALLYIHRTK